MCELGFRLLPSGSKRCGIPRVCFRGGGLGQVEVEFGISELLDPLDLQTVFVGNDVNDVHRLAVHCVSPKRALHFTGDLW